MTTTNIGYAAYVAINASQKGDKTTRRIISLLHNGDKKSALTLISKSDIYIKKKVLNWALTSSKHHVI